MTPAFQPDEAFARQLDAADPLARCRDSFHIPRTTNGQEAIYFCGHSLGLQPKAARAFIEQELDDWARLGVEGHFHGGSPWYGYHELFRDPTARLVGGIPVEVVLMNSLTVNLHLMLTTFYQPTPERFRILTDEPTFPSDQYAIQTHMRCRGVDPAKGLLTVAPRGGAHSVRIDDIHTLLEKRGKQTVVVLLNGVNFFNGQYYDIPQITAAAHAQGCVVGFDLAHAAGNVPLALHDWGSISPSGATTSTSTAGRAPSAAASSMSGTVTISRCRGWQAGGGMTRRPGFGCTCNLISCRLPARTAGS